MPPASNEEQFKFLISCIRYSNNGKVDFGQVAQECKIVSKGAAAKRYERMMRAHGIAPNAASIKPAPSRSIKTDRCESTEKPSKKRKADAYVEDNAPTDDDENFSNNIKLDPTNEKEKFNVKEEEYGHDQGQQLSMNDANSLMQYYNTPSPYGGLGGGHDYPASDYGGSSGGYATPIGGSYGVQAHEPFEFTAAYDNAGIRGISRTVDQTPQYQPMIQYPVDPQGQSDSPVIVE